jgi:glycosyltransferase involved in cell wall biosynthesis
MGSISLPPLPISITIPLYNRADWINRALTSARQQTFTAIEIIVVDDCSTDSGPDVVRRQALEDWRIRLIRLPQNRGTHFARSVAVLHAAGTWILSLDPDDELFTDIADKLWRLSRTVDTDIIMFRAKVFMRGRWIPGRLRLPKKEFLTHDELVRAFYDRSLNPWIWGKLIRTSVYRAALLALNETEQNARIIAFMDVLHSGMVYLKARSMLFLPSLYGYAYYIEASGSWFLHGQREMQRAREANVSWVPPDEGERAILRRHYRIAGVGSDGFLVP